MRASKDEAILRVGGLLVRLKPEITVPDDSVNQSIVEVWMGEKGFRKSGSRYIIC